MLSKHIQSLSNVILQIPVVAADQLGKGSADGLPVPIDDQLQQVLIHLHHHRCHLLSRHEEDYGEESDLELRTDSNKGSTHRFHQALPAEL